MNISTWVVNLDKFRAQHGAEFFAVFGVPIERFWDKLTGFDVIAFDEWISPVRDESTMEAILRRYGEGATFLVDRLATGPDL